MSWLVGGVLVASAIALVGAQNKTGKLFSPLDLVLLEGPDRDQWQQPEQVMDTLCIGEGSIVADVGAAGGWFAIRLAQRVGPRGIVYAEDVQPPMLEGIRRRVRREGLLNVKPWLGTPTDPRLPPGMDVVLIISTYAEMDDPVALMKSVARSLKPLGRLGIVDFNPGGGGPGPAENERVAPQTIIRAAEGLVGLRLLRQEPVGPFQYLLVFGKERNPCVSR